MLQLLCQHKQKRYVSERLESMVLLFYQYILDGEEILTTKGEFGEANVHDQSGISFKTPPYPDLDITKSVKVRLVGQIS